MNKSARRRKAKTKVVVDSLSDQEHSDQTQIIEFFSKVESNGVDVPECAVPSPDAAALPSPAASAKDKEDNLSETKETVLERENPDVPAIETSKTTQKAKTKAVKAKRKKNAAPLNNSRVTDFFPVRRSNRKTLPDVLKEKQKCIEEAILLGKEEGFEIKDFPGKGRGVITNKAIKRGDFVLEYYGELIDYEEASHRESVYATKESIGCYMYYFTFSNKKYCIDATEETGRLGRLVNHSKKGNLRTQPLSLQNSPRLALFACRDIAAGEELSYDYGDRSRAALESNPWLAL